MRIKMMQLSALLAMRHRKNPKAHDLDDLRGSFIRFGFTSPPMIDESTQIMVAGHGRCEALEMMRTKGEPPPTGIVEHGTSWMVPVIRDVSFKSERERDAYLVADNQLSIGPGWSDDALADMLGEFEESELDGLGFSADELADLLAPNEDNPGTDVDVNGHVRTIGASHKVRPPVQMTNDDWDLHLGDCLEGLRKLADNSIDAVITDPPAGIGFMGRSWDSDKGGRDKWIAWLREIMAECLRVLKPGGHLFAWALPRTSHWTALAIEDAGFQIRDRAAWLYLSGFPKSADPSKLIDAHLGKTDERPVLLHREDGRGDAHAGVPGSYGFKPEFDVTSSATEQAAEWEGWGTALKPALEDWWLARKPLEGTIAENLIKWGVGCLNIAATRIGESGGTTSLPGSEPNNKNVVYGEGMGGLPIDPMGGLPIDPNVQLGRWPSHLAVGQGVEINDVENPALYFYCPKPSKSETEAGLDDLPAKSGAEVAGRDPESAGMRSPRAGVARGDRRNTHPTKKPIELMRWLVRLVTPPGSRVCDPFAGSGTTGLAALVEGCRFVGFEQDPEFHTIAVARLRSIIEDPRAIETADDDPLPTTPKSERNARVWLCSE